MLSIRPNNTREHAHAHTHTRLTAFCPGLYPGEPVAEWLACWTQAQKGLGSNRSRGAVG